ncbi:MAG: adenylate kinase [Dehalococcoidia bacterium]
MDAPNHESTLGVGRRIAVIGTAGSGKTTLAGKLARRLGGAHIELDALFWGPEWTPVAPELFRERVQEAVRAPAWVSCGNYTTLASDVIWTAADTLVWLDYGLPLIFRRLFVRSVTRVFRRTQLWGNNRETLRAQFLSRDSLFLWALKTHGKHRREWPERLHEPRFAHLRLVHLRSPKLTERFLASIAAT